MSDQFKVVFSGTITEGFEPETVITAFAEKFKCSDAKARGLVMAGKETLIKSGLDRVKAERYVAVLTAIGLDVKLVAPQPAVKPAMAFELEGDDEPEVSNAVAASESSVCPKCGSKEVADDRCPDCKIVVSKYLAIQDSGQAFTSAPVEAPESSDNHSSTLSGSSSSGAFTASASATSYDESAAASSANPYQAPQADLSQEYEEGDLSGPVSVPASHGWSWLAEGFGHFKQNPVAWIVALVIWVVISSALSFIPFVGMLLILVYPIITAGFMLGCREQAEGGDFEIGHLFSGFNNNVGQLVLVGLLYMVGVIVVSVIIGVLIGSATFFIGGGVEQMGPGMMSALALPMLVGLLLFIPLIMAYWFAPTLVALNDIPAIEAMKLSFSACLKNLLPFLLYGLIAFILFIVGTIPFALGLLIVMPMTIASLYTSYRDIFYN
ncbi:BPSS1780 family membrane protein [Amphritea pacifica]|uniref:Uncharacterized protein n=1 Tax=Amphritea pacifica TaxID=2811233 RepID=A0ABS2W4N7_9GAMM|nr:BPSS1780 family membrane protein [Amphritea pacifica]MBN0986673.1 hypothetical protein [Amphritea pacifica]MBN1007265.1 hypothetical protein [Amphritea pacifica]